MSQAEADLAYKILHCLAQQKYQRTPKGRSTCVRYDHSPKGKARATRYHRTPKAKLRTLRYLQSPKGKLKQKRYTSKPEVKEHYLWLNRSYRRSLRTRRRKL